LLFDNVLAGRWVSAEPAAPFAAFVERGSRSVLDAAVPALLDVCLSGALRCTSALPADDFAAGLDLGFESVFDAFVAAGFEVVSFFAIG
jgi:hypothetical protein